MDRVLVSKDVLFFVLGYGGVSLYGKLNALSIEFKIASSDYIVNAVLEFPLDPHSICTLLNYDVRQSRVDRIVRVAQELGDLRFMNESEFRKLIVLQLGLAHLRISRPHPHKVMGQDILEVLLRSLSRRLTPDHSTSVRVLQSLILQIDLALDVGDRISRMQTQWDLSPVDFLCIETVFMMLYHIEFASLNE